METRASPENLFVNSEVHIHNQTDRHSEITRQEFLAKKSEIVQHFFEAARLSAQVTKDLPELQLTTIPPVFNESLGIENVAELTNEFNGNINLEDVLTVAKKKAIQSADKKQLEGDAYDQYVENHSRFVAFIGPTGSGKTTLSNIFVQKLLNTENSIFPDIEYLFYIKLQYVNYDDKFNILQFFATSIQTQFEPMSKEMTKLVIDDMTKSTKCVFIFDGLDDSKMNLSKKVPFGDIYKKAKAKDILKNIFSGKLFSKSLKIVTSPNHQVLELHPNYRPCFNVYILGLNIVGIREVCRIKAGENKYSRIMSFLEINDLLLRICYSPAFCNFLVERLINLANDRDSLMINSTTSLLLNVLTSFCRSTHARSKEKWLGHLCQLAYHSFINEKFTLEKCDWVTVGINWKNVENFLIVSVREELGSNENIFEGDIETSFCNIILHELFCAVNIMTYLPFDDFKTLIPRFTEKRFKFVAKFVYGMGSKTVQKQMRVLFGPNFSFHKKQDYLIESACKMVRGISPSDSQKHYLFSWLREMDEAKFVDKFVPLVPDRIGILDEIYSDEIMSYSYLLNARSQKISLYIGPQFIGDSCSRFLAEVLTLLNLKRNIEVCWLRIRSHQFTKNDIVVICSCLGQIRELTIEDCDVTELHVNMLKQSRSYKSKKTKILGIDGLDNNFDRTQSFRHSRMDLKFRDDVMSRRGSRYRRVIRHLTLPRFLRQ